MEASLGQRWTSSGKVVNRNSGHADKTAKRYSKPGKLKAAWASRIQFEENRCWILAFRAKDNESCQVLGEGRARQNHLISTPSLQGAVTS